MSRPLCSVHCAAKWSLGENILGVIAEMGKFYTTEDVLLKTKDGILQTGHTHQN